MVHGDVVRTYLFRQHANHSIHPALARCVSTLRFVNLHRTLSVDADETCNTSVDASEAQSGWQLTERRRRLTSPLLFLHGGDKRLRHQHILHHTGLELTLVCFFVLL